MKRNVSLTAKIRKGVFLLLVCLLFLSTWPVTAHASAKSNMKGVVTSLRKGQLSKARKYNKRLPKVAPTERSVKKMSSAQKKAFRRVVTKVSYKIPSIYNPRKYLWGYYLTDLDNDGKAELITKIGSCEADAFYRFYRYKSGRAVLIGKIGGGHSGLSAYPGAKGILLDWGVQGGQDISRIYVKNGRVKVAHIWTKRSSTTPVLSLRYQLNDHITWDSRIDNQRLSLKDLR